MNELRQSLISEKNLEPKEGQRELLRSSKNSLRCPSLDYNYIASSEEIINKAFDLLFEEVIKIK